jgi:hypothetical protein
MRQLHFAAIGDDTGKIEWLVPARHFVFIIIKPLCCMCACALRHCLRATACHESDADSLTESALAVQQCHCIFG